MAAIMPVNRNPKIPPITVPKMTIQTASKNFAFSFPIIVLPDSHKSGDMIVILTTI
jgi:hypothetical protein